MNSNSEQQTTTFGRLQLDKLTSNITCRLCRGYFIDATTLVTCMHTFCRSCIVKHVQKAVAACKCKDISRCSCVCCPLQECSVLLSTGKTFPPFAADPTIQEIVYKLVPNLYQNEMKRRQTFFEKNTKAVLDDLSDEDRGIVSAGRHYYTADDRISVSLEYGTGENQVPDNDLSSSESVSTQNSNNTSATKRYLLCPANLPINLLKKFLKLKYDLPDNRYQIELMYNQEYLDEDCNIVDVVYKYRWRQTAPLRLFYRVRELPMKRKHSDQLKSTTQIHLHSKTEGKLETSMPSSNSSPIASSSSSLTTVSSALPVKAATQTLNTARKSLPNISSNQNFQSQTSSKQSHSKSSLQTLSNTSKFNKRPLTSQLSVNALSNATQESNSVFASQSLSKPIQTNVFPLEPARKIRKLAQPSTVKQPKRFFTNSNASRTVVQTKQRESLLLSSNAKVSTQSQLTKINNGLMPTSNNSVVNMKGKCATSTVTSLRHVRVPTTEKRKLEHSNSILNSESDSPPPSISTAQVSLASTGLIRSNALSNSIDLASLKASSQTQTEVYKAKNSPVLSPPTQFSKQNNLIQLPKTIFSNKNVSSTSKSISPHLTSLASLLTTATVTSSTSSLSIAPKQSNNSIAFSMSSILDSCRPKTSVVTINSMTITSTPSNLAEKQCKQNPLTSTSSTPAVCSSPPSLSTISIISTPTQNSNLSSKHSLTTNSKKTSAASNLKQSPKSPNSFVITGSEDLHSCVTDRGIKIVRSPLSPNSIITTQMTTSNSTSTSSSSLNSINTVSKMPRLNGQTDVHTPKAIPKTTTSNVNTTNELIPVSIFNPSALGLIAVNSVTSKTESTSTLTSTNESKKDIIPSSSKPSKESFSTVSSPSVVTTNAASLLSSNSTPISSIPNSSLFKQHAKKSASINQIVNKIASNRIGKTVPVSATTSFPFTNVTSLPKSTLSESSTSSVVTVTAKPTSPIVSISKDKCQAEETTKDSKKETSMEDIKTPEINKNDPLVIRIAKNLNNSKQVFANSKIEVTIDEQDLNEKRPNSSNALFTDDNDEDDDDDDEGKLVLVIPDEGDTVEFDDSNNPNSSQIKSLNLSAKTDSSIQISTSISMLPSTNTPPSSSPDVHLKLSQTDSVLGNQNSNSSIQLNSLSNNDFTSKSFAHNSLLAGTVSPPQTPSPKPCETIEDAAKSCNNNNNNFGALDLTTNRNRKPSLTSLSKTTSSSVISCE